MATMSTTVLAPPAAIERPARPCLHAHPPATPSSFFAARRRLLHGLVGVFGLLATAAVVSNGWLLLHWDKPFQRMVEGNRSDMWDIFFRTMSRMGSTVVVLSLGVLLAVLCVRRCKAVAVALIVATFARPAIEFILKELVERDRPDFERMVQGTGYSFPSGHPFAAMALYGMIPVVVGLFTTRRTLWWASVAVSAFMIVAIGFSRVYLGVHWLTDVVAGMIIGALFLMGVEWVLHRMHGVAGCARAHRHPTGPTLVRSSS